MAIFEGNKLTELTDRLQGQFVGRNELKTAGAHAYNSADISIANTTFTVLNFDSERFDTDNIHDNVTNNNRLTCHTPGTYVIVADIRFDTNGTGDRLVLIRLNGATHIASRTQTACTGIATDVVCTAIQQLAINDYVEVQVFQSSGGALNIKAGDYNLDFSMALNASTGGAASGVYGPDNPTALVGLAAINGTSTSFMRADAAPALNQAIAPTWTGNHKYVPAANSTTTFQVFQQDGTTIVFDVDTSNKRVGIGTAAPSAALQITAAENAMVSTSTYTDAAGTSIAHSFSAIANTTADNAQSYYGLIFACQTQSANGHLYTGTMTGIQGFGYHYGTNTLTNIIGAKIGGRLQSSGNVTTIYGLFINSGLAGGSGGNVTAAYDLYLADVFALGTGTLTTQYGLYVAAKTSATNNYAIYTVGGGLVRIGDTTDSTTSATGSIITLGGVGIAKALTVGTGFGCNTKGPQTAFASGGAAPAGGTGTAAGGYDTAAHRDAAITLLNNIRTALVNNGIMS